jgi:hypothetical protein
MSTLIRSSVLSFALLTGCGAGAQAGLANAPVLGGATPDARVHDVVANGRDACERSAFPAGEVLRGQIPPCTPRENVATISPVRWTAPRNESPAAPAPMLLPFSPLACSSATQPLAVSNLPLALSWEGGLACRSPW